MNKVLITGGAGFIGSHLTDTLMSIGSHVHVFDNFTSGTRKNLNQWLDKANFTLTRGDLLNTTDLAKLESEEYRTIFHLAADPEVRVSSINPGVHFQQNVVATQNLLEYIRKTQGNLTLVFASTSTVYGEPTVIPTPEDYSPLEPISVYGATKLASEALMTAYSHTYGFKVIIYRLANIIGPRSQHGVIRDFIQKLSRTPNELEVLGDGTQNKSYLHISDCVQALIIGTEKSKKHLEVYNVGSNDQITVKEIAQIIIEQMGLQSVKLACTGGVDGGRGWVGDVKSMLLDVSRIKSLGWKPELDSRQSVQKTAREILEDQQRVCEGQPRNA